MAFQCGVFTRIATPKTIADGAQTQSLGQLNFALIRRDVTDVLTVTDWHLVEAMRFFAERMNVLVEPTGARGFAAAWHGGLPLRGKRVGVIMSGGNVRFATLIGAAGDVD